MFPSLTVAYHCVHDLSVHEERSVPVGNDLGLVEGHQVVEAFPTDDVIGMLARRPPEHIFAQRRRRRRSRSHESL